MSEDIMMEWKDVRLLGVCLLNIVLRKTNICYCSIPHTA